MILEITYGYTVKSVDDSFIYLADEAAVESLRYGTPGATLCDIVPICEGFFSLSSIEHAKLQTKVKFWPTWMPFSFYQRHAAYTRTLVEKLFIWPLNWAEQQIVLPFLSFQDPLPLDSPFSRQMESHSHLSPETF
jgi:hypothetical protein